MGDNSDTGTPRNDDHWAELVRASSQISSKMIDPALATYRNDILPASAVFPSFASQLAATVPALKITDLAVNAAHDELFHAEKVVKQAISSFPPHLLNIFNNPPLINFNLPVIDQTLHSALQNLLQTHDSWLEELRVRLEPMAMGLHRAVLPPNLRDLAHEITAREVRQFVEEEAVPLYLIPRSRVALRLIRAKSRQDRRKVLNSCFHPIIDDCETVLTESQSEVVADQVRIVLDGIGAIRAGYIHSAQALFTVTLDTLITRLYPDTQTRGLVKKRKKDAPVPEKFNEMGIREALVWLPIWNAHEEFWPKNGVPVPHHFSRHASVHAVTSRQFNKRNCIQALMLVASLVGYANDLW